jgi:hypothetical protein
MEICKTVKPEKTYFSDSHFTECHLYSEQIDFRLNGGRS